MYACFENKPGVSECNLSFFEVRTHMQEQSQLDLHDTDPLTRTWWLFFEVSYFYYDKHRKGNVHPANFFAVSWFLTQSVGCGHDLCGAHVCFWSHAYRSCGTDRVLWPPHACCRNIYAKLSCSMWVPYGKVLRIRLCCCISLHMCPCVDHHKHMNSLENIQHRTFHKVSVCILHQAYMIRVCSWKILEYLWLSMVPYAEYSCRLHVMHACLSKQHILVKRTAFHKKRHLDEAGTNTMSLIQWYERRITAHNFKIFSTLSWSYLCM